MIFLNKSLSVVRTALKVPGDQLGIGVQLVSDAGVHSQRPDESNEIQSGIDEQPEKNDTSDKPINIFVPFFKINITGAIKQQP